MSSAWETLSAKACRRDMLSGSVGNYERRVGKNGRGAGNNTNYLKVKFHRVESSSSLIIFSSVTRCFPRPPLPPRMCKNSAITSSIKSPIIPLAFDALMVIVSHFFHHHAQQAVILGVGNNERRGAIADFSSYSVHKSYISSFCGPLAQLMMRLSIQSAGWSTLHVKKNL
ncbi:hypothetical protein BDQ17DRAFT_1322589 [Cyathus striatus]|nr:hypothetical protein BDQ17DRAFT_1322589 [Cyathus striatus]